MDERRDDGAHASSSTPAQLSSRSFLEYIVHEVAGRPLLHCESRSDMGFSD